MKHVDTREAISLLRSMTWVLCAVGILALVFTTVNVTRFATILLSPGRGVRDVQHELGSPVDLRGGGGYLRPSITWILEVRCLCNGL
nr:hypothetical protein [Streptomyces sp. SID5914]